MRLLVVSQYFWPENFRVNDLVAEMAARGHEVTVLTGHPNYPDGHIFPEFKAEPRRFATYAGAPIVRVPMLPRGRGNVRLILNYLSFVVSGLVLGTWRLRGRDFDAIFVFQTSPITSALPALLLRRLKRAPLLMWVLDLWPDTLAAVGAVRSPKALAMVGCLVSFIYRRCDLVLVQSRAFLPNIQKYLNDSTRVRYFPNWVEPVFEGLINEVQPAKETEPYANTFNVLFAGNIGEAQDFPSILDAAQALNDRPQVRWLIIGDGRAAGMVRTEILRRGLGERVILLGRHPLERMPSFFRAADALLVTLKSDPVFSSTIPGKVQNYLSAGLPILGMLDGEGAKVIMDAGAGLVCPSGQGMQLANCVRAMTDLTDPERAAMGARGRAYCQREFDRSKLMSAFQSWAEELAAARAK